MSLQEGERMRLSGEAVGFLQYLLEHLISASDAEILDQGTRSAPSLSRFCMMSNALDFL